MGTGRFDAVVDPRGDDGTAADEAALAGYATALADAVDDVLAGWVRRCVVEVADRWRPGTSAPLGPAIAAAGEAARADVGGQLRALLATDVDLQATGPLAVLRQGVRYPTAVLADAGVPPVAREAFAQRAFPDDRYDLAPAAFADVDPSLHEPGLVWGAAKAHVVLARRRAEGLR